MVTTSNKSIKRLHRAAVIIRSSINENIPMSLVYTFLSVIEL